MPWFARTLKVLEFEDQNLRSSESAKSTLGPWKTLIFEGSVMCRRARERKKQKWDLKEFGSYPSKLII